MRNLINFQYIVGCFSLHHRTYKTLGTEALEKTLGSAMSAKLVGQQKFIALLLNAVVIVVKQGTLIML
jgi:hypothetical protein